MTQSLHQAADVCLTVSELAAELELFGTSQVECQAWMNHMHVADVHSAGNLLKMSQQDFDTASRASLSALGVVNLCTILGSMGAPHVFLPGEEQVSDASVRSGTEEAASSLLGPHGTDSGANPIKTETKFLLPKGGELKMVAEQLQVRRPFLTADAYYPPATFDLFQSSTTRSHDRELRKLIVQEVDAVCGDLYPDKFERSVILSGLEALVGPPLVGGHWDNWHDASGKKHKGSSISDLEKSRRDPTAFGVSGRCVPNRMRPTRLKRAIPLPAGGNLRLLSAPAASNPSAPIGTLGTPEAVAHADLDAGLDELDSPGALQKQVVRMAADLEEHRKMLAASKAADKAGKEAAKALKAKATKAAKAAKAAEAEPPTAYEGC